MFLSPIIFQQYIVLYNKYMKKGKQSNRLAIAATAGYGWVLVRFATVPCCWRVVAASAAFLEAANTALGHQLLLSEGLAETSFPSAAVTRQMLQVWLFYNLLVKLHIRTLPPDMTGLAE